MADVRLRIQAEQSKEGKLINMNKTVGNGIERLDDWTFAVRKSVLNGFFFGVRVTVCSHGGWILSIRDPLEIHMPRCFSSCASFPLQCRVYILFRIPIDTIETHP